MSDSKSSTYLDKKELLNKSRYKKPSISNTSYVISVKLYKGCYRHIQIDGTETLTDLALAILDSFGFNYDHLSAFYMNNRVFDSSAEYGVNFPSTITMGLPNEARYDADDYTLNDFNFKKGKKFVYLFDYGADWEFRCTVLRILDEPTDGFEIVRSVGEDPDQYGYYDYDW